MTKHGLLPTARGSLCPGPDPQGQGQSWCGGRRGGEEGKSQASAHHAPPHLHRPPTNEGGPRPQPEPPPATPYRPVTPNTAPPKATTALASRAHSSSPLHLASSQPSGAIQILPPPPSGKLPTALQQAALASTLGHCHSFPQAFSPGWGRMALWKQPSLGGRGTRGKVLIQQLDGLGTG